MIEGKVHHFSAGGLYNGLVLLIDDETRTYWDHITGVAVHGELTGTQLPTWPLLHTTVQAARLADPATPLHRVTGRPLKAKFMGWAQGKSGDDHGFTPPPFRGTMAEVDPRLPERVTGLGVVCGGRARFFPIRALRTPVVERWHGRRLRIAMGQVDGSPHAVWEDDGSRPMQMLARWYGFSFSYPGCEVFGFEG